jgi:hypothetical protein
MRESQDNEPSKTAGSICAPGSIFNQVLGNQCNNYTIIIDQMIVQQVGPPNFLVALRSFIVGVAVTV